MSGLEDLDDLSGLCRDLYARRLFEEAVACYRIGAYRACVVAAWVAVCFDLFRKLREVARIGDSRAREVVERIDLYQRQLSEGNQQGLTSALAFERSIVNTCLELEILDSGAETDLRRLQEDRNRCAHPNFERLEIPLTVSAEQARLHLRSSVRHVLAQNPIQGRAALQNLRSLISSPTFPLRRNEIRKVLLDSPLARASESLVRGFIDLILYELSNDPACSKEQIVGLIQCVFTIYPRIAEERFRQQFRRIISSAGDSHFINLAHIAIEVPEGWSALGEGERQRIKTLIERSSFQEIKFLLPQGISHSALQWAVMSRVEQCETEELGELIRMSMRHEFISDQIVQRYSSCANWDSANYIAAQIAIPGAKYLNNQHVLKILEAIQQGKTDVIGSFNFPVFLIEILKRAVVTKQTLIEMLEKLDLRTAIRHVQDFDENDADIPF